jgi:N-formylglutamate amidohydrolase
MAAPEMIVTHEQPPRVTEVLENEPTFEILHPERRTSPLIHASPHSGRIYPPDLMRLAALDAAAIRSSEDVLVDEIVASAQRFGAPLLKARLARAYVDVNREPFELDPGMFVGDLPSYARARTARVAAGLGSIARVVGEGREIYSAKLPVRDALERIDRVHGPYHQALADLIQGALERFDVAVLLDWHSMPSAPVGGYGARAAPDVVLGDRFGASCGSFLVDTLEKEFSAKGYRVARNAPYAGGYTTEHYGRPQIGVHAVQVELNRALYLDERSLRPGPGFEALARDVSDIIEALANTAWTELQRTAPAAFRRAGT